MRDLMMLGALLLFVPLSFANPFNAYLLWGWTAVVSPAFYLYGFMQSVRFNLIFAAIALGMLLVRRKSSSEAIKNNSTVLLMTLFLMHTGLCVLFGYPDNPFNEILGIQFFKSILFCLVMAWFVSNRLQMHAVLIMLALGLGFHGVLEGLKVITSGGAHLVIGIPTTMMSDNNHFGVGMVMVIPLLYYLQQHSLNRLAQFGYWAGLLLTVVAVLGTNSRGGMVALAIVGLWFFISSRHKFRALVVVALVSTIVFSVAPASWFERMNSIKDAGEDSSFMGRVAAWKISSAIALENPLTGGGFHSLQVQSVWEKFKHSQGLLGFVTTPEPDLRAKAAHSIYFEILGDMGFLGLMLFLAILGNVFFVRYQIKLAVKKLGDDYAWALDKANAIFLALLAYAVGGAAVSLGYFELPYMLAMLMEMLRQSLVRATDSAGIKI